MCTVSFIYKNGLAILTSNRDEKILRPTAIEPKNYLINSKKIFYPKDQKAGGTWFAVDENGTVLILLNGAQEKHILEASYRKSRGLIVLDLIANNSPLEMWFDIDLEKIEPFTIVLFQNQKLYQLQWNGLQKNAIELDIDKQHVWSSSTLYDKDTRNKRSQWFYEFLEQKQEINPKDLLDFHKNTQSENTENGLVINRNNVLKTISITQAVLEQNKVQIQYLDLNNGQEFSSTFIKI